MKWAFRVVLLSSLAVIVCPLGLSEPAPVKQDEVRRQILDMLDAMEPQYAQRAQLLQRSAGSCRMELLFEMEKDSAKRLESRIEKKHGMDGSEFVFQGQNVADIVWKQRDEDLRYDVYIPKDATRAPNQAFPPQNKRIAANQERGIYYNAWDNVAYINDPPTDAFNPTSLLKRFEVGELYLFQGRDVPVQLRELLEQGLMPAITEVTVNGQPCVKLSYARDDKQTQESKEYLWERRMDLVLAPAQGYSLIEGMHSTKYYVDGVLSCEAYEKYDGEYHDSTDCPGVWLLSSVSDYTTDEADGVTDAIRVEFEETTVGVDVADVEFTFEGLGVPPGTRVDDKRLDEAFEQQIDKHAPPKPQDS